MTVQSRYKPGCPVFELTLNCNLNCIHCGSSAGKKFKDELTTKEAIKICHDMAKIGSGGVALMGGEVLLRKDWDIISKEIKNLGMKLSIVTNGYFNPKNIISKLIKLEVDSVTVGLDGIKKTHNYIRGAEDAFDKTINFIKLLKNEGLDVCPITTFHKININEFFEIRELILSKGLDWSVNYASLIGRFPKNLLLNEEEYYELTLLIAASQKKYSKNRVIAGHNMGFNARFVPNLTLYSKWTGCIAGKLSLGIKSNGDVNGCLPLPKNFTEGNVKKKSLIKIWNDPNSFRYSREFKEEDIKGFCSTCKYKKSCKGGCTLNSVTITGNIHNDPYCLYRIEQEIFGRNIEEKIREIKECHSNNL